MKKKNRILCNVLGILCIVLWVYIAVVFTMLGRRKTVESQVELRLFWCVQEAWTNRDPLDWYLIVGNISLFVPLGAVISGFFEKMRNWWKVILCGFVASLSIEITQLVMHVGLFELDDLFHNTLGAYLGYCLCMVALFVFQKDERKGRRKSFVISFVSWVAVIVFFGVAIAMGQPVFGWLGV